MGDIHNCEAVQAFCVVYRICTCYGDKSVMDNDNGLWLNYVLASKE